MEKRLTHLGIRIEKSIVDQLHLIARADELPLSALVRKILKSWLKLNAGKIRTKTV